MSASLKRKHSPVTSNDLQSNAINSRNYQYTPFRKRHRCSPRCCSTWLSSLVLPENAPFSPSPALESPNLGLAPPFLHVETSLHPPLPPPAAWAEGQLAQRGEALSHRHTHTPPRRWLVPAAGGVFAFPAPTKRSPPAGPRTAGHAEPKFRLIGWALIRGPLRPPLTPNDIDPLHLLPRRSAPGAPAVTLCETGENK